MAFNSNTWYSIQNFGNDFFVGCSNVGSCGTTTLGLADQELFQFATVNGSSSYYIRPKAVKTSSNGEAYCVNINTGTPTIATCSNQSATWGVGNWNGQNASDGKFFFSTQRGDSQRLYLGDNETYSLLNYSGLSQSSQALMQWGVSSRAVINDQSYSTVPAGITGGLTSTTRTANLTTTSTATSTAASTAASTSVSNATSTSGTASSTLSSTSSSNSPTVSSSASPSILPSVSASVSPSVSTSVSEIPPSTSIVFVTPTVTASQISGASSSRAPSSTVSPTVVNGATMTRTDVRTVLVLTLVLSQAFAFLS